MLVITRHGIDEKLGGVGTVLLDNGSIAVILNVDRLKGELAAIKFFLEIAFQGVERRCLGIVAGVTAVGSVKLDHIYPVCGRGRAGFRRGCALFI